MCFTVQKVFGGIGIHDHFLRYVPLNRHDQTLQGCQIICGQKSTTLATLPPRPLLFLYSLNDFRLKVVGFFVDFCKIYCWNCLNFSSIISILVCVRVCSISKFGPVKFQCGVCEKPVGKNDRALECEACSYWVHQSSRM